MDIPQEEKPISDPAPNKTLRILSGVFWFSFFLGLILIFAIFGQALQPNSPKNTFTGYFKDFFSDIKTSTQKGGKTIIRNELIQEESTTINVVESVSPAVVSIVVKTVDFDFFSGPTSTEDSIGTGFIVDENGLIITNSHVVDNEDGDYSVVLNDGRTFEVERINLDPSNDLAILEISARDLPAVTLGDSEALKVGQSAIAIGNALGQFQNTVTVGVVSGVSRQLTAANAYGELQTYENIIQTDAALNPGNSGGPLLNSAGQVIGINVATTRGAENISFAIPVNTLRPVLEGFLAEGRIIKPYIGVSYTMITREIAALRNLPEGAFITRIFNDSPADTAGLERADIVTKIGGEDVTSQNSLGSIIGKKKVGDKVELVVDRDGEEVRITVTLEEIPEN